MGDAGGDGDADGHAQRGERHGEPDRGPDHLPAGGQPVLGEDDRQRHQAEGLGEFGVVEPDAESSLTQRQPESQVQQEDRQPGAGGHPRRGHRHQQDRGARERCDVQLTHRHVRSLLTPGRAAPVHTCAPEPREARALASAVWLFFRGGMGGGAVLYRSSSIANGAARNEHRRVGADRDADQ